MAQLTEWLQHAPSAKDFDPRGRWQVFLSYRSVHRPWVIQLYDVLRGLGLEVFLDQYVLAASQNLIAGLQEGMANSSSGVLVWSTATQDSAWCNKEYLTMEHRATNDSSFHYVVVTLDKVQLPLFAQQNLYVDFSDYREGPRGAGLLRLLHGLIGKPLPDAAVRLATSVDDDVRSALTAIKSAVDTGNGGRLAALPGWDTLAWATAPMLGCETAEGLIKLKRYDETLTILAATQERFPKAIRPRQLRGLALARKGDWRSAQEVLGELAAAGEQDPETLGIYARTWNDRYMDSKDRRHLEKSRDLYAQAFRNAPSDYYTGINAAAKSVFLDEVSKAREIADQVEKIVGKEKVERDYWKTATVAEVQLIKGNYDAAAALYAAAVATSTEETGSHSSTWGQAQRLLEFLKPTDDQRKSIAGAFTDLKTRT